jgi:hypothetical protein
MCNSALAALVERWLVLKNRLRRRAAQVLRRCAAQVRRRTFIFSVYALKRFTSVERILTPSIDDIHLRYQPRIDELKSLPSLSADQQEELYQLIDKCRWELFWTVLKTPPMVVVQYLINVFRPPGPPPPEAPSD